MSDEHKVTLTVEVQEATQVSKIPEEFEFIQKFLNALDVQYFVYRRSEYGIKRKLKITIFRLSLLSLKLVLISFLMFLNTTDMMNNFTIGSSFVAAAEMVFIILYTIFLISLALQTYRLIDDVKKIYDNFFENLNRLRCHHSIELNFNTLRRQFVTRFYSFVVLIIASTSFIADDYEKAIKFYLVVTTYLFSFVVLTPFYYVFHVDLINQQLQLLSQALKNMTKANSYTRETPIENILSCRNIFNKISNSQFLLNKSLGFIVLQILVSTTITITVLGYKMLISFSDISERISFFGKNNKKTD